MSPPPIRTLVVDDDYRVASIHAAYVAKVEGFVTVGAAHTAARAVEAARDLRAELVLLDIYLPDGDGLEVVRTLTEQQARPDVLVITAARDVATVRTAMQFGAVHYLVKPFGFAALRERLVSYRSLRLRMAGLTDSAEQADVDALFSLLRQAPELPPAPPKGHSAPTLELVRNAVKEAGRDVSAAEVAELAGISRATAQRYLTFLTRHGILHLHLRYGGAGRPEHRYSARSRATG